MEPPIYANDMSQRATARFDVTGWDVEPYDTPEEGPGLARGIITKVFRGDLDGGSEGYGLFCGLGAPEDGAGYLVSERFQGHLRGRAGTFVMQHGGLMGGGLSPRTFGTIVPGSGTGALAGLRGTVEISRDAGGEHTITVAFALSAP
jgi:hypothetical protein